MIMAAYCAEQPKDKELIYHKVYWNITTLKGEYTIKTFH